MQPNAQAPAFAKKHKVLLYATCLSNYSAPDIGLSARAVLAHNGIETEVLYPECCGMPQLEQGNVMLLKRCDAMRCDAMRCDAMRCDAMRCDAMRCDVFCWFVALTTRACDVVGLVKDVVERAKRISAVLLPYVERGYSIVTVVASCALMLKHEWRLLSKDAVCGQRDCNVLDFTCVC
jgi:glycerol-3-phosphate dehydrogenase subunit C